MFFNLSVLSFTLAFFFSIIISWKILSYWKKERKSLIAETLLKAALAITFYTGIRAIASFFFPENSNILALSYLFSHFFLAFFLAYITKFIILNFYSPSFSQKAFCLVLGLSFSNLFLNIFFPNQPSFNQELNIIEWGTQKYVAFSLSLLMLLIFLAGFIVCLYNAYQLRSDWFLRTRSLLFGGAFFVGLLSAIFRELFPSPLSYFLSEISVFLPLFFVILTITIKRPSMAKERGVLKKI